MLYSERSVSVAESIRDYRTEAAAEAAAEQQSRRSDVYIHERFCGTLLYDRTNQYADISQSLVTIWLPRLHSLCRLFGCLSTVKSSSTQRNVP